MSEDAVRVRAAEPGEASVIAPLAEVLIDCVEAGASVSFMSPLALDRAEAFWRDAVASAQRGERLIFLAEQGGRVLGVVQVILAQPENQPHRGDVSKMLVRQSARGRGVGAALMQAAEDGARAAGKTLLVLDTANPAAERLYERSGWTRVGVIPNFALMPDGAPCATTYYYKQLG